MATLSRQPCSQLLLPPATTQPYTASGQPALLMMHGALLLGCWQLWKLHVCNMLSNIYSACIFTCIVALPRA